MQGALPLILYTVLNHPSVDLKDTIWSQLEGWLNGLGAQFSEDDVKLVRMLSHHVSYFLKAVNDD